MHQEKEEERERERGRGGEEGRDVCSPGYPLLGEPGDEAICTHV